MRTMTFVVFALLSCAITAAVTNYAVVRHKATALRDRTENAEAEEGMLGSVFELAIGVHLDVCSGWSTSRFDTIGTATHVTYLDKCKFPRPLSAHKAYCSEDATRIPYRDNTFCSVSVRRGLCCSGNAVAVLREMMRVCRPGGRILVIDRVYYCYGPVQPWTRDLRQCVQTLGATVVYCHWCSNKKSGVYELIAVKD